MLERVAFNQGMDEEKVQDATRKAGTVDGAIVYMKESDAKYLHLELQQVVRLERGVRTANNTGRGEVPREQGAGAVGGDAPEESESDRNGGMAEGGTERMPDAMVRWSDVEELWDGNQAHMGGGDMDVEGEENNRQGSGADENVDPAAGTQQQSGRRWGRRAPRRRTRRGHTLPYPTYPG
ncbi:hypothetical protein CLOP_g16723 [Closterium sp. NIES-67]|nr:hypothetical protein CLOP_g16723 [Closterium sp. NIES-67]